MGANLIEKKVLKQDFKDQKEVSKLMDELIYRLEVKEKEAFKYQVKIDQARQNNRGLFQMTRTGKGQDDFNLGGDIVKGKNKKSKKKEKVLTVNLEETNTNLKQAV